MEISRDIKIYAFTSLLVASLSGIISLCVTIYTVNKNTENEKNKYIKDSINYYLITTNHRSLGYKSLRKYLSLIEYEKKSTLLIEEAYIKLNTAIYLEDKEILDEIENKHFELLKLFWALINKIKEYECNKKSNYEKEETTYKEKHKEFSKYLRDKLLQSE